MTFIKLLFLASLTTHSTSASSTSTTSTTAFIPTSPRICSTTTSTTTCTSSHRHDRSLHVLHGHKNSGRARVEKNLEDMMGNDWRMFRAHLVAQEQAEALEKKEQHQKHENHSSFGTSTPFPSLSSSSSTSSSAAASSSSSVESNGNGKKMQEASRKPVKHDKLGTMLASIFKQKSSQENNPNHHHHHHVDHPNLQMKKGTTPHPSSIFDGKNIAGASSLIPKECQDPFVSISEIPVLLQPKVKLNKHRWAHAIPHVEPGCVLVANEKLGGIFHQTVLLIVDHNDKTGSTGIVINRPLDGDLLKIASEKESSIDLSLKLAFNSAAVSFGGPIMPEEYSVLHGYGEVEGAKKVAPGVFVGGSAELMKEVRRQNLDPKDALFVLGHAAWVPGQLSREISKGVWYIASCSSDLILRYAGAPTCEEDNTNDLWSDVLECMGGKYAQVAQTHAGKGDMRLSDKKLKP